MKMSQPLRVDYPEGMSSFITRRVSNYQLVYVNNKSLVDRSLACIINQNLELLKMAGFSEVDVVGKELCLLLWFAGSKNKGNFTLDLKDSITI